MADRRNDGTAGYKRAGVPKADPIAMLARRGYEDWRTRRPFPREYEHWNQQSQQTYEAGRRAAASLAKHVRPLPVWSEDREFGQLFPNASAAAAEAFLAEDAFTSFKRSEA